MNDIRRHAVFLGSIVAYVVLMKILGLKLVFFTYRFGPAYGIDHFLLASWCTCYWRGPYTGGTFDPYPYRSGAILLGVLGIAGTLFLKIAVEYGK
jgi:hypothetical protein